MKKVRPKIIWVDKPNKPKVNSVNKRMSKVLKKKPKFQTTNNAVVQSVPTQKITRHLKFWSSDFESKFSVFEYVPGTLCVIKKFLEVCDIPDYPFSVVRQYTLGSNTKFVAVVGDVAMYMGSVLINELEGKLFAIVERHKFLINNKVYIVSPLLLTPYNGS